MNLSKRAVVKRHILAVSKKLFLKNGYSGTSIRDIAKAGDLTVGKMYNYYNKKEDIFSDIIKPIIDNIEKMTISSDLSMAIEDEKIETLFSKQKFKASLKMSFDFINHYRDEFKLAFFKSEGFCKVDIKALIIDAYSKNHQAMMKILKKRNFINHEINNKSIINNMAKFYISIYEEFISNEMSDAECEKYIDHVVNFIYYGQLGFLENAKC